MLLAVRVTPRGGHDAVEGWARDGAGRLMLRVRVAAVAAEGRANLAAVALIAKQLGRAKSQVKLVSGHTARLKRVEIDGLTDGELALAFGDFPQISPIAGTKPPPAC